jgi:AcrR family transcriptional regulator
MAFSLLRPGPADTDPPTIEATAQPTLSIRERSAIRRALKPEAPKPGVDPRRRQLRVAVARTIAEKGILRATVHGFARAAEANGNAMHPACTRHEDLLAEIMVAHLDTLMRRVCEAYDRTATKAAKHRLEVIIGAFLGCALEERNEHRLILRCGDVLDERGQVSVYGRYRSLAGLYAEVLEAAAPRAMPAAAMVAAMSLVSAMSCAVFWFHDDGAVSIGTYARVLTTMTMAGVRLPGVGDPTAPPWKRGGKTP